MYIYKGTFLFLMCNLISSQNENTNIRITNFIRQEELKKHVYYLAAPEMEGREILTNGEERAARYIQNNFIKAGLLPGNNNSYRQFFNVYYDSLIYGGLEVNDKKYKIDSDFLIYPTQNTANKFCLLLSEITLIGHGSEIDFKSNNLVGKAIMILVDRTTRLDLAMQSGAIALILLDRENIRFPMSRSSHNYFKSYLYTYKFKKTIDPIKFFVSEQIAKEIAGQSYLYTFLNYNKPMIIRSNLRLEINKEIVCKKSCNVVSFIKGSELPNEYLVLSAHYDHLGIKNNLIYFGADDNASGVAALLEIAEAFAKCKRNGIIPKRSIIFIAFSGEEFGHWGSEHYIENPPFSLSSTIANLNMDMVGRIDTDYFGHVDSAKYVYTIVGNELKLNLGNILEVANRDIKIKMDNKYNSLENKMTKLRASDQFSFFKKDIPIIFFSDGYAQFKGQSDYHQPTDTPEKINYPLLTLRTKLVMSTTWQLANRIRITK